MPPLYKFQTAAAFLSSVDIKDTLAEISEETSCHEQPADELLVTAMVTEFSSSNQADFSSVKAVVSDLYHSEKEVGDHSVPSDFVVGSSHSGDGQTMPTPTSKLSDKMDSSWQQLETVMCNKQDSIQQLLEDYGIGEGEDSESEEGQIWKMIQGDAPYTIELV